MTDTIQALEAKLESNPNPRETIDALNALAWELRHADLPRAIALSQQAGQLASQADSYQHGLATSLRQQAAFQLQLGNYTQALSLSSEAIPLLEAAGDLSQKAHALNDIGEACLFLGNYPDALAYLLEALNSLEAIGDQEWLAGRLNTIGHLYLELDQAHEALTYLDKSLQVSQFYGYKNLQADALCNSCDACCRLGDYDSALACGMESVQLYQTIQARQGEAKALENVGNVYHARGEHAQALAYFRQALHISQLRTAALEQEIEERRRAEQELRRQNEYLAAKIEAVETLAAQPPTLAPEPRAEVAAGVDDSIGKPVRAQELHTALERRESIPSPIPATIDWTILDRLRPLQKDGEPDFVQEMIDLYLTDTPPRLADIRQAIAQGDAAGLQLAAHTLKSNSNSLGMLRLGTLGKDLEDKGRSSNIGGAEALLAEVEREFERVCQAFKKAL